ncbi:MAG TPA: nuclear transport factor 2 family protein [Steroidobacteraceae bacterium]|nr:nuclear transport factor 2 family protein [Steroidobacteraceae bacterium]
MTANWSLSALDRLEIQELYARYAWGIDLGDIELALSTFAPDAWFDHLWQGRVQGHEAIRRNLESLWYDRQSWWYGRQHMMNHFIMDALEEPGTARVRCFFQILQFNVEYRNNFVFGIGTRDDVLARIEGRWVFTSLRVNAWTDMEQVPWKAELRMKPRPTAPPPGSATPGSETAASGSATGTKG